MFFNPGSLHGWRLFGQSSFAVLRRHDVEKTRALPEGLPEDQDEVSRFQPAQPDVRLRVGHQKCP